MSQSPIFDYCCHGIERGDCDQCSRAMTDTRSSPGTDAMRQSFAKELLRKGYHPHLGATKDAFEAFDIAIAASGVAQAAPEPDGYNGCYRVAIEALNYLASHTRPAGGQERFNAEHLLQIADEMKRSRASSLPSTPDQGTSCEHGNPAGVCTICHMWSQVSSTDRGGGA